MLIYVKSKKVADVPKDIVDGAFVYAGQAEKYGSLVLLVTLTKGGLWPVACEADKGGSSWGHILIYM